MSGAFLDLGALLLYETDAVWLGMHAQRIGVEDTVRAMVPDEYIERFIEGASLPPGIKAYARGLADKDRKRVLRMMHALAGKDEKQERQSTPLAVAIQRLIQRSDVGTSTRYDLALTVPGADGVERVALLRDLRAVDILNFERLRPVAMDAGVVLDRLKKGQGEQWIAEVQRAMDDVEVVPLSSEYSEAGEIREILSDLTETARPWEWSEDEPFPLGVRAVQWGGRIGWSRNPLRDEIRQRMGRVSRVALSRAVEAMGWREAEWRDDKINVRLRVWTPVVGGGE